GLGAEGVGRVVGVVDGLVHAGEGDGGVAGELAGGEEEVLVPRAAGKALGGEKGLLGGAKGGVEGGQVAGGGELAVVDGVPGRGEAGGGSIGGGEVEVEVEGGGLFTGEGEETGDLVSVGPVVVGED